ncbi:unnamed protein product [Cylindrotheca closterium]|uniref:Steroid 5-alpha reductase C-terminal domain-containing protein n=1 Tax=Cylindrotheca closterium TaxID=2856 RepID=A0AAD2G1D7_9STRA|nr:unnamed protein product [Cylindrotheca closterium]
MLRTKILLGLAILIGSCQGFSTTFSTRSNYVVNSNVVKQEPNKKSLTLLTTTSTHQRSTTTKTGTSLSAVTIPPEVLTSFLPPILGFYRSEFGVSYAYGLATALSGVSILRRFSPATNTVLPMHAMALIFYGFRLNAFLAIRTLLSARLRAFIDKIEERAKARGNRLSRAPFIISCGFLYYGLAAPLFFTSQLTSEMMKPSWVLPFMKTLVGLEWFGFGIAAIGDFTKTFVKKTKGDDTLVTSGIFSLLRHPNYTGEMIGWTANSVCGLVGFTLLAKAATSRAALLKLIGNFIIQSLGLVGITFVLMQATTGLEKRQQEKYGDKPEYASWVKSSWGGWTLPAKKEMKAESKIELDESQIEEYGSGI